MPVCRYHTIHHTHYHYNYGQFFVFCDWFWGTLKESTARSQGVSRGRATSEKTKAA